MSISDYVSVISRLEHDFIRELLGVDNLETVYFDRTNSYPAANNDRVFKVAWVEPIPKMTIFSLQLFRHRLRSTAFSGSLWLLILSILCTSVPAWSNEPTEPKNFLGWCQTRSSWPVATQRTIDYLLSASSRDCVKAAQALEAHTELLNSDPKFASTGLSDLRPLASLTNLKNLNIISDDLVDLRPLAKMKNLESLAIARSPLTDLAPLGELKQLRALVLLFCPKVTDLKPISRLSQLNRLVIGGSPVSDLSPISQLLNLEEIILGNAPVVNLQPLATLRSLRQLEISGGKIQNLQGIDGLTGLKKVELSNNQIRDLRPIAKLTNLTFLNLSSNQIRDLSPLAGLTKLTGLDLNSNRISNINPLISLKKIRQLGLHNNQITTIQPLHRLNKLERLLVFKNPIRRKVCPVRKSYICDFKGINAYNITDNTYPDMPAGND
jgi:internalin A